MNIIPYLHYQPKITQTCSDERWVSVIGRTTIGERCHFSDLVTLRADGHTINVGSDCWFGEYATVHIADSAYGASLASHVTVGRFGLVHGCSIGEDCVLGEHAVVMDNAQVGSGSVICSDSVVPPGKQLESGWLYQGVPAKPIRKIDSVELATLRKIVKSRKDGDGAALVLSNNPVANFKHEPGEGVMVNQNDECYIAPTAAIVGSLEMAAQSSIWFAVEIDAKDATVQIGAASNIQDSSRITLDAGECLKIGKRVTVGHNVRLNACEVGDSRSAYLGWAPRWERHHSTRWGSCGRRRCYGSKHCSDRRYDLVRQSSETIPSTFRTKQKTFLHWRGCLQAIHKKLQTKLLSLCGVFN